MLQLWLALVISYIKWKNLRELKFLQQIFLNDQLELKPGSSKTSKMESFPIIFND